MSGYKVIPYSKSQFVDVLEKKAHPECDVASKGHIDYFDEYFNTICVKTMLIEEEYVDKDFLEDFSAYYVRCFGEYRRFCARIHFFTSEFDGDYIEDLVCGKNKSSSDLESSYAGFLVIKPLPKTIIGRTCLMTYQECGDSALRQFPANRDMYVNLLGMSLKISSLAFQEQDTDVAACATSALWSAFQGTGRIFQHSIPSPVEITRSASINVRGSNRSIPANEGLTADQMADAIRSVGLEPHAITVTNSEIFRSTAYAYLRAGIPCLCIGVVRQIDTNEEIGWHAVTLTGYRLGKATGPALDGPQLWARNIDRLYVHDDQVGPFARLRFPMDGDLSKPIITSWTSNGKKDNIAWDAKIALVPIYHKIRVPFNSIVVNINYFDALMKLAISEGLVQGKTECEWDIYLTEGSKLKRARLLDENKTEFDVKIIKKNLPKYIWVAEGIFNGEPVFQIVFDATDLLQGSQFISVLPLNMNICKDLANFCLGIPFSVKLNNITRILVKWFSENIGASK